MGLFTAPRRSFLSRKATKKEIVHAVLCSHEVVVGATLLLATFVSASAFYGLFCRSLRPTTTSSPQVRRLALVINLARRNDRWQRIYKHLHANSRLQPYTIERLEAIDGRQSLDLAHMVVNGSLRQRAFESVMSTRRRIWGQELTLGAVGCLLSHAKAWERALHMNASILVLEDDVELSSPGFEALFPRVLNELPTNFGLLYLGDMAKDYDTIHKTAYSENLVRISRPLWGTYAYVVSPLAARRLLLHMYPAELQVDSYIKQVADLYDADMPNFAVAQDIVYTDNSETRDTDAQARGMSGDTKSPSDVAIDEQLRYHVLLAPSVTALSGTDQDGNHLLKFDTSYSMSSSASPQVSYHDEHAACTYALDLGLFGPARKTAAVAQSEFKIFRARDKQAWRWLLCVAVSMRHGGLCFTEPFTIVRSIEHLLYDVSIGFFLASSSTSADAEIMSQVVYAYPRSIPPIAVDDLRLAVRNFVATITAPRNQDRHLSLFALIQLTLSEHHVTRFPPHIFDPPHPLMRPCHCSAEAHHGEDQACRSRCERLVAPPFAAGFPTLGGVNLSPVRHVTPLLLHMILPAVGDAGSRHAVAWDNIERWKRLHAPPTWAVNVLVSQGITTSAYVEDACAGLAAVVKHGGVYVDSQSPPRQALLSGALRDWSMDSCAHNRRCHQPAPVVAMRQARNVDEDEATSDHRRPLGTRHKQLSLRFFAAPTPNSPVAKRLSSACENALAMIQDCGGDECKGSTKWISLQLQQVLADDAWSVAFVREDDVFE